MSKKTSEKIKREKKAAEKKKKREVKVAAKMLWRRAQHDLNMKKEREEEKERIKMQKTTNRLEGRTIRIRSHNDENVKNQLEHNMEILKALEAEMAAAENVKEEIKKRSLSSSAEVDFTSNIESNENASETK